MSYYDFSVRVWRKALGLPKFQYNQFSYGYHGITVVDLCVFKKLKNNLIANLIIPAGSRVHITNHKCRADKAFVHSIFHKNNKKEHTLGISIYDSKFIYQKGEYITPRHKFSKRRGECESGIHFFIRLGDALAF